MLKHSFSFLSRSFWLLSSSSYRFTSSSSTLYVFCNNCLVILNQCPFSSLCAYRLFSSAHVVLIILPGTYTRLGLLSLANFVIYLRSAFLILELSACARLTAKSESVMFVPHIIVGV